MNNKDEKKLNRSRPDNHDVNRMKEKKKDKKRNTIPATNATASASGQQLESLPGAYDMASISAPTPGHRNPLRLSAGAGVSRARLQRKEQKEAEMLSAVTDNQQNEGIDDSSPQLLSEREKIQRGLSGKKKNQKILQSNDERRGREVHEEENEVEVEHTLGESEMVSAHLVEDAVEDDQTRESLYRQAQADAKEEMLKDVYVAEEVKDELELEKKKCRKIWCAVICLVVFVPAISAVLGLQPWKEDDNKSAINNSNIPINDLCTGAIAMSLRNDSQQFGTTVGASPVMFDSCTPTVQTGGRGVWYKVEGTGRPMRVSTCGTTAESLFDPQISMFQGSCDNQVCVGGNDDGADEACGVQASLAWPSELGKTYFLCVHGKVSVNDEGDVDEEVGSGRFNLTLEETVENDFCEGSITVDISSSNNEIVEGSTFDATSDTQVPYCHGTESTAPGVWYSILGRGLPVQAAIINTDTNVQLTAYEGNMNLQSDMRTDCSSMRCIAGYDNPFEFDTHVTFATKPDTRYYILVHGVDGQRGAFQLQLQETAQNDVCEASPMVDDIATVANQGGQRELVIEGSTDLATIGSRSNNGGRCGDIAPANGAAVWYKIQGTGSEIRAKTCRDDENNLPTGAISDTFLMVFEGDDCQNLRCVDGNNNQCGAFSSVSWPSAANKFYYVLVGGNQEQTGSFILSFET